MAQADLSLVKFHCTNFFAILLNTRPFFPISTNLIKIVENLIESEPEPDLKHKKKVQWIYENTHERVNKNLAIVELAVFKNLDKGLNREITIGNKDFPLTLLYKYLNEVNSELALIVTAIAKKYSVEIEMTSMLSKGNNKTDFS